VPINQWMDKEDTHIYICVCVWCVCVCVCVCMSCVHP
jgi:hypothetical protein